MPGTRLRCAICATVYGFIPMLGGATIPAPRLPLCRACAAAMVGPGRHLCQDCGADEGLPQLVTVEHLGPLAPPPTYHVEYRCVDCAAAQEAEAARQAAEDGTLEADEADDDDQ